MKIRCVDLLDLTTYVLPFLSFKSTGPCYTKLFRVRNVESGSKGNDLVIRSEEDDEYTRFPLSVST